jgi:hypothetical protein
MKKFFFSLFLLNATFLAYSQKETFTYGFYGFVRGDLYYNSRQNIESVDGLFYLYPKDISRDADGSDLDAVPNSSFYTFTTRLGIDMKGPDVGAAKTSAKIETDFGGTTDMNFMLRVRQAYVKFDWNGAHSLLLGQTWHPLFGDVIPNVMNLSTGSPFQPFNRSPQINYQWHGGNIKLTASALYQLIYTSVGPDGKSEKYQKNGILPELYAGADYRSGSFLAGGGVNMLSLKPRLQHLSPDGGIRKVNERVTSFSYDLHAKYQTARWQLAGKTLLASNLTNSVMLGGFGVSDADARTGEQHYVPFKHSTSWLNAVYGTTWQTSLFAGYTKNLGTSKALLDRNKLYGMGLNIDRLLRLSLALKYVLPHWNIGLEYMFSNASYGENDLKNGKVINTRNVINHRIESTFMYVF